MSVKFDIVDSDGNRYMCKRGKLMLQLALEDHIRHIGKLVEEDGVVTWWKRVDEKNIHHKTASWALPMAIYERIDRAVFSSKNKRWTIELDDKENKLGYFQFKKTGMEKQVYIKLKYWTETII